MLVSELIRKLVELKHIHGDLLVTGNMLDTSPRTFTIIDKNGIDIYDDKAGKAREIYIQ